MEESGVDHYDTKLQSKEWKYPGSSRLKTIRVQESVDKILALVSRVKDPSDRLFAT